MAEPQSPYSPSAPRRCWQFWGIIFIGLLATAVLFSFARRAALDDFRTRFEVDQNARVARSAEEIGDALAVVKTLAQFVEGTEQLNGGSILPSQPHF